MATALYRYRIPLGSVFAFLLVVAVWETVILVFSIPAFFLPKVQDMVTAFTEAATKGNLLLDIQVTAMETIIGFILGSALGAGIGYPLAKMPALEKIISPYVLGLQIAPKIALAPLFMLWFGFGLTPKVLIAVLMTFFPVLINVIVGVHQVNPDYVEVMRSLNATRWQVFWKVEFPSSLPMLFAGLRITSTIALIAVVVGELVGANTGLGYLTMVGSGLGKTALVFVAIFFLTLIGIALYSAVVSLERRVLRWQRVN